MYLNMYQNVSRSVIISLCMSGFYSNNSYCAKRNKRVCCVNFDLVQVL